MSKVSRSVYQKVCEENKRLIRDLRTICYGDPAKGLLAEMKWRKHFRNEEEINKHLKEIAKQ